MDLDHRQPGDPVHSLSILLTHRGENTPLSDEFLLAWLPDHHRAICDLLHSPRHSHSLRNKKRRKVDRLFLIVLFLLCTPPKPHSSHKIIFENKLMIQGCRYVQDNQ